MGDFKIKFSKFTDIDCTKSANEEWSSETAPIKLEKNTHDKINDSKPVGGTAHVSYGGTEPDILHVELIIRDTPPKGGGFTDSQLKTFIDDQKFPDIPEDDKAQKKRDKLYDVVKKYDGKEHSPPYVQIVSGDFIFKGMCSSFEEKILTKDKDLNLKAVKITLKFKSTISIELANAAAGRSSPDMTHYYTVKEGETLPIISNKIYGRTSLYLALAKFNNLHSPRFLKAGEKIIIPPLIK
tara:strand:+ start:549 stop:1265 length:717 start_codon:yes stop_codon:yes gene_type:complete